MKGIKINKRPIKQIKARHMVIAKKPENKKIEDTVENVESIIEQTTIVEKEPVVEEKKPSRRMKKTTDKKEEDNKETEE